MIFLLSALCLNDFFLHNEKDLTTTKEMRTSHYGGVYIASVWSSSGEWTVKTSPKSAEHDDLGNQKTFKNNKWSPKIFFFGREYGSIKYNPGKVVTDYISAGITVPSDCYNSNRTYITNSLKNLSFTAANTKFEEDKAICVIIVPTINVTFRVTMEKYDKEDDVTICWDNERRITELEKQESKSSTTVSMGLVIAYGISLKSMKRAFRIEILSDLANQKEPTELIDGWYNLNDYKTFSSTIFLSGGSIAAILIGILVFIVICVLLICYFCFGWNCCTAKIVGAAMDETPSNLNQQLLTVPKDTNWKNQFSGEDTSSDYMSRHDEMQLQSIQSFS